MGDVPDIDAAPPCTTANAFGNEITSPVGGTGVALVTAKFNTGQTQDVAISLTTDTVILAGDGAGTFAGGSLLGTASTQVAIEDFDLIGSRKDLLLLTPTSVVVRQQSEAGGAGNFLAEQALTGPFTNAKLASTPIIDPDVTLNNSFSSRSVGNMGLNGVADVAIHDDAGNTPFLSLGTAGTFQRGTSVGAAGDELVLVAQIDKANDADLVLVDAAGNVKLALSNGSDGFQAPTIIATGAVGGGVAVGNFDGDTFLDLVVSTSQGGVIYLQNSASPGVFTQQTGAFTEILGAPLMVGDVNKDGLDDVITPTAVVMQCPTTHAFTQKEPINATQPAILVDVTGNGKLDLLRLSGTDLVVRVQ